MARLGLAFSFQRECGSPKIPWTTRDRASRGGIRKNIGVDFRREARPKESFSWLVGEYGARWWRIKRYCRCEQTDVCWSIFRIFTYLYLESWITKSRFRKWRTLISATVVSHPWEECVHSRNVIFDYYYENIVEAVLEQLWKFYSLTESDYLRAAFYKYLLLFCLLTVIASKCILIKWKVYYFSLINKIISNSG